jgi:lysine 2,3-aminomutase
MSVAEFFQSEAPSQLYRATDPSEFLNHLWQDKNSITRFDQLENAIQGVARKEVLEEIKNGLDKVGMSIRINPYMLDMVDWDNAHEDPIRRQFLPMISEIEADHACMTIDSLEERNTTPAPNLVHRYPDKVLFLVTSVCPVYCQFCTRSYAVGQDTASVQKDKVASPSGWEAALNYIRNNPAVEDVVVSGGDIARLKPKHILALGNALLDIEHVKRIRFATKALSVQPMKFLTDEAWFSAIVEVANKGRAMFKSVFIHSHFNHPREVTPLVEKAMRRLFSESIYVRNQTVLLRGVNDDANLQIELATKLGRINIQPYYVYNCDMVMSNEHFRISIPEMQHLEREVRGSTAGFNTPLFIVDTPGGGGKRDVHSFEYRNEAYGITGYRSPSVDPNRMYYYFDPIRSLSPEVQAEWQAPGGRETIFQRFGLDGKLSTLKARASR